MAVALPLNRQPDISEWNDPRLHLVGDRSKAESQGYIIIPPNEPPETAFYSSDSPIYQPGCVYINIRHAGVLRDNGQLDEIQSLCPDLNIAVPIAQYSRDQYTREVHRITIGSAFYGPVGAILQTLNRPDLDLDGYKAFTDGLNQQVAQLIPLSGHLQLIAAADYKDETAKAQSREFIKIYPVMHDVLLACYDGLRDIFYQRLKSGTIPRTPASDKVEIGMITHMGVIRDLAVVENGKYWQ